MLILALIYEINMSDIRNISICLTASIWFQPGTSEELFERKIEKLQYASEYMFNIILMSAKAKGWIYEKNNIWFCYKKTAIEVLKPNGFDIE